jgi:ElaB/YqjD/DUF883 family membrane-anchored ribosome-binding protein
MRIETRMNDVTQRLSPKNLMDETVEYVRDHGGPYYDRLGRIVTNHPLPLAMIGIGLLWLATSTARGATTTSRRWSSTYSGGDQLPEPYELHPYPEAEGSSTGSNLSGRFDSVREKAGAASADLSQKAAGLSQKASDLSQKASAKASDVSQMASTKAADLSQMASSKAAELSQKASSVRQSAARTLQDLRSRARTMPMDARQYGREARDTMAGTIREQPLLVGAAGALVGMAVAALLPTSRIEEDLLGGFGSSLTDDAKDLADRGVETVKKHAEKAAGDLQEQLGSA